MTEGQIASGRRNDAEQVAGWSREDLTDDAFLNGQVQAWQPKAGFRAGLDSVFLAAAVRAGDGETVLEVGMGAGIASLCLLARRPTVHVEGLEIDSRLAALAAANAARNRNEGRMVVHMGDALRPPRELPRQAFDAVMTNPPFLISERATTGPDEGKSRAIALDAEQEGAWFKSALSMLKPKGALTVIHRADALVRLLSYLSPGTGGVEIFPLYPSADAPATRIVVTAKKGSRAPLRLSPGLILHGPDGRFTPGAERILREAAALSTSP